MLKTLIKVFVLIGILAGGYWYLQPQKIPELSADIIALDGRRLQFETNQGTFEITLSAKLAPKTVENFIQYVKSGFFNGTIFHRVISDVIIQGGGFDSEMKQRKTNPAVSNESNNGLLNIKGSVAMARLGDPDSATSQFYINLKDNKKLDFRKGKQGYTVFAQVSKGLDLLINLSKRKVITIGIHQNVPSEEIKLISVKLMSEVGLKETLANIETIDDNKINEKIKVAIQFKQGVHYQKLDSPLSLTKTKKVEVISAFSYGCGHCYGAYSQVDAWKKGHLKDVDFSYFHAVWNSSMRFYAKTYYTAIELGVDKQLHIPIFEAIVINQIKLSNVDEMADFFAQHNVDRKAFIKTFESERIEKRVIQAEKLTKKFNLASVPEFIVSGKYRVDPMRAGGQNEMFELLDFLVKKE